MPEYFIHFEELDDDDEVDADDGMAWQWQSQKMNKILFFVIEWIICDDSLISRKLTFMVNNTPLIDVSVWASVCGSLTYKCILMMNMRSLIVPAARFLLTLSLLIQRLLLHPHHLKCIFHPLDCKNCAAAWILNNF